jgi:hypothetical protein
MLTEINEKKAIIFMHLLYQSFVWISYFTHAW